MKYLKRLALFLFSVLLVEGCTNVPYKKAVKTLRNEQYQDVITQFDDYIQTTHHPAFREKAKEDRSYAYYQLGLQEYQTKNYEQAAEYFYLSNSDIADSLLDNCYFQIAKTALEKAIEGDSKQSTEKKLYGDGIYYELQLFADTNYVGVLNEQKKVESLGYTTKILPITINGIKVYRLRLENQFTYNEADAVGKEISSKLNRYGDYWIAEMNGSTPSQRSTDSDSLSVNNEQFITAYDYLTFIMYHLEKSELMPEVLLNRLIVQYEYMKDIDLAYSTYQVIQDKYAVSDAFDQSTSIVDEFLPEIISRAEQSWKKKQYEESLKLLFVLNDYPASYQARIQELIGNVYYTWADELLTKRDLEKVQEYFLNAVEYNPNLSDQVDNKLVELATVYINRGDQDVEDRNIDEGIRYYQKAMSIIPNYSIALTKIDRAQEIARRIEQAKQLVAQGDAHFANEEYQDAYVSYSDAYKLDSISEIADKIQLAYIWTRISNDPEQYAIELIKKYQDGFIISKINELESLAQKNFSRQDIRITPWQVFRSVTENSYEVRYTIVVPDTNYFFRWLVRLETGEIIPLNDSTEEMFSS